MEIKEIIKYAIISCVCLAAISYAFFSVIFLKVKKSIKKTRKLQLKFNELTSQNFKSLVRPIELLVVSKSELKPLVDFFKTFDVFYRKQIESALLPLQNISDYNNHYNIAKTNLILNWIEKTFINLESVIKMFKILSFDSTAYQTSASKVLVECRTLYNSFLLFMKQHILTKYDNKILKRYTLTISDELLITNNYLDNLKNDDFLKHIDKFLICSYELLYLINNIYHLDLKYEYLKYIYRQIDFHLKTINSSNTYEYSDLEINQIKNALKDSESLLSKISNSLYMFQFKDANAYIDYLWNMLVPLKKQISNDQEAKSVLQANLNDLLSNIKFFNENQNAVNISLQKISNNFQKNQGIVFQINKIINQIDSISKKFNSLDFDVYKKQSRYSELLTNMNDITVDIVACQENLSSLVKSINSEMEEYKHIIQDINNLKLMYIQLNSYMLRENIVFVDNIYKDLFNQWIIKISRKNNELVNNYNFAIQDIEFIIKGGNDVFDKVIKMVAEQSILKLFAQNCLGFIYKYKNENVSIASYVKKLDSLYSSGEYEKTLQESIKVITKLKNSAQKNEIRLD